MKSKPAAPTLPSIGISQILGLVELLKSTGGKVDIYQLAGDLSLELGETLSIIKAAKILNMVGTNDGEVLLEKFGDQIVEASITERKDLIREKLEKLPLLKSIREFLIEKDEHEATRNEVLEKLADLLPNENAEDQFTSIVSWGRYGELFGYNDDSETFYLDPENS